MNKLIKISNNHYIVVDDGEIKEGDYKYHHALGIRKALVDGNYTNTFKITHSTQPLESYKNIRTKEEQNNGVIPNVVMVKTNTVKSFSLSEVEEVIYGYSVEKLCDNFYKDYQQSPYAMEKGAWRLGFKAHQELVKDKLFTIDDMRIVFNMGYDLAAYGINRDDSDKQYDDYIKSILPPTEWNVEFIDDKIKLL